MQNQVFSKKNIQPHENNGLKLAAFAMEGVIPVMALMFFMGLYQISSSSITAFIIVMTYGLITSAIKTTLLDLTLIAKNQPDYRTEVFMLGTIGFTFLGYGILALFRSLAL